jgi:hypothetical protein
MAAPSPTCVSIADPAATVASAGARETKAQSTPNCQSRSICAWYVFSIRYTFDDGVGEIAIGSETALRGMNRRVPRRNLIFLNEVLARQEVPHLEQVHAIVPGRRKGEAMKLRIKGNSLRLRVSRCELTRFLAGERIAETIRFASALEAELTYGLARDSRTTVASVHYLPQEVKVVLSEEQVQALRPGQQGRRL